MAEINSPIEFQRGTAGVPESVKECDTVLPEGLDIGLGPGDRAFEPHYSDHVGASFVSLAPTFIVLTKTTTGSASGKKELIARGKVDK